MFVQENYDADKFTYPSSYLIAPNAQQKQFQIIEEEFEKNIKNDNDIAEDEDFLAIQKNLLLSADRNTI